MTPKMQVRAMSKTTFHRIWRSNGSDTEAAQGFGDRESRLRWNRHQRSKRRRDRVVSPQSRGSLLLLMLVGLFLAAGCGGDTGTVAVNTGPLTAEDLPGLLPDADTAGSVLGVTFDRVDERSDLSQAFEHTDIEDLEGAYVGFYRVAGDPDGQSVPIGSSSIQLALYETSDPAAAAMEAVIGEVELDPDAVRSEFDVAGLADAGQGFVFSGFTWTMLRWDTLLVEIVAFHEPDTDLIEEARGLAEEVKSGLLAIEDD